MFMSSSKITNPYQAPSVEEIDVAMKAVICQSGGNLRGNEWIPEEDLGDGGFK